MPDAQNHLKQYQHNKELLCSDVFKIENDYRDWIITIGFYSALHIIEKAFAELDHPQHFKGHERRNKFIFLNRRYDKIASKYQALYNQSIRARYDCANITKTDVQVVRQLVEDIEKELLA